MICTYDYKEGTMIDFKVENFKEYTYLYILYEYNFAGIAFFFTPRIVGRIERNGSSSPQIVWASEWREYIQLVTALISYPRSMQP